MKIKDKNPTFFKFQTIRIVKNEHDNDAKVIFRDLKNHKIELIAHHYDKLFNILHLHIEFINKLNLNNEEISYVEFDRLKNHIVIRYRYNGKIYKFAHEIKDNDFVAIEFFNYLNRFKSELQ